MTETEQEKLEQELYCKSAGFTTALTVFPGGRQDGLDYGPVLVEIVVLDLDGDTIAYRVATDSHDDDWQMGQIEDAIEALTDYRETAAENERAAATGDGWE